MAIFVTDHVGVIAAECAADALRRILNRKPVAEVVFATGASQFELLDQLLKQPGLDWSRVRGWHLDEYLGLPSDHPASFQNYLRHRLVDRVALQSFEFILGTMADPQAECRRLNELLRGRTIDLALIGIGENGHVAFNDPPADWQTTEPFIVVELDEACRRQQCGEGWFADIEAVPRQAITMSCQQILQAEQLICTVPDRRKAEAVRRSLSEPPQPQVPASCLQHHPRIRVILDSQSAAQLPRVNLSHDTRQLSAWYRQQSPLPCPCFDLQINGAWGVDFNDEQITGEQLLNVVGRLEGQGVAGILVTLITDDLERMRRQISRIAELRRQHRQLQDVIRGFHLEGPFLSAEPGYCGAHPSQWTCAATPDRMEPLLDAGQGLVRLVTLAPERDRAGQVTRLLVERGVLVAAGHTNATRTELQQAIDQGLSLFTHLGNACPTQLPRHDNIITRALSLRQELMFTLIADGVHVPDFVWRDWCEWIGYDRVILISDATAAAGCGEGGEYRLGRQEIRVSEQNRSQFDSNSGLLAGSLLVLPELIRRLQTLLPPLALEKLAYRNARRLLPDEL